jgi:integrase
MGPYFSEIAAALCNHGYARSSIRRHLRAADQLSVIPQGLERAEPPVLTWRHSSLPRHIESAELERMIGACNPGTLLGLRERAVITLLAHLGLRAGEVIRLKLDDIDWLEGRLIVRAGKNHRERSLSLSQARSGMLRRLTTSAGLRSDLRREASQRL